MNIMPIDQTYSIYRKQLVVRSDGERMTDDDVSSAMAAMTIEIVKMREVLHELHIAYRDTYSFDSADKANAQQKLFEYMEFLPS